MAMDVTNRYEMRYRNGNAPWDVGRPDSNLISTVRSFPIEPCKALDIGCGTGDNSIWLSQEGFQVVGVDSSKLALNKAREKALEAQAKCKFINCDFLEDPIEEAPFGFAFDRGCFHSFSDAADRKRFARKVAECLGDGGFWLSLSGNADEARDGPGPPRLRARDIVEAVEDYFEILSLVSGHFESRSPRPPRAWICLMRKRS
jgi:SAM-dependent methyltransferase